MDACATDAEAQEHNVLHHQCYMWLRRAKTEKIESKRFRVCALARQRAARLAVDSPLRVKFCKKIHKKVKAIIVAIAVTRLRLKIIGAEQGVFSRSGNITSLVSKLK